MLKRRIIFLAASWSLLLGLCCTQSSLAAVTQAGTPLPGGFVTLVWNTTWGGINNEDACDVVRDTNGNLFVGGYTSSWGFGSDDALIGKFNSNGELVNNATFGSSSADKFNDIDITPGSQIVGVGRTQRQGQPFADWLIVAWDTVPKNVSDSWLGSTWSDNAQEILTSVSGTYYIGGVLNPSGADIAFVTSMSDTYTQNWNFTFNFNNNDDVNGLARDKSGNVYLAGRNYTGVVSDIFLSKLDATGHSVWNKTWDGGAADYCASAVLTPWDHLLVVGYYNNTQTNNFDLLLAEFDLDGTNVKNITWGGSGSDVAQKVAFDANNNIYVVGCTTSYGAVGYDGFVAKFKQNGDLLWNTTFGGAGWDQFNGLVLDGAGGIYIVGQTNSWGAGVADVLLLKLHEGQESTQDWWWIVIIVVIAGGVVGVFLYFKIVKGRKKAPKITST